MMGIVPREDPVRVKSRGRKRMYRFTRAIAIRGRLQSWESTRRGKRRLVPCREHSSLQRPTRGIQSLGRKRWEQHHFGGREAVKLNVEGGHWELEAEKTLYSLQVRQNAVLEGYLEA